MGDHLVDKSKFLGARGVEMLAGGVEGKRALVAEAAGQSPRGPDFGQQAEATESGNDLRAFGGDDQVAGECPREAHAGRGSVQGGDERSIATGDEACDGAEFITDPAPDVGCALLCSKGQMVREAIALVLEERQARGEQIPDTGWALVESVEIAA